MIHLCHAPRHFVIVDGGIINFNLIIHRRVVVES